MSDLAAAADPRRYPARPFLAASVAVLRGDAVLLAVRAHPPAAHVLSLPGGVVEPGETLAEAALRELREEVAVEARIGGVIGPVEVIERDAGGRVERHFVVIAHWAEWLGGEARRGPEALDTRWLAESEIEALGRPGGLRTTPRLPEILRRAFGLRRAAGP